jgi:hypothetical protein
LHSTKHKRPVRASIGKTYNERPEISISAKYGRKKKRN